MYRIMCAHGCTGPNEKEFSLRYTVTSLWNTTPCMILVVLFSISNGINQTGHMTIPPIVSTPTRVPLVWLVMCIYTLPRPSIHTGTEYHVSRDSEDDNTYIVTW